MKALGSVFVGLLCLLQEASAASAMERGDVKADTTPPVITLIGAPEIIVECGGTYDERGATAMDDVDGDITVYIGNDSSAVNTTSPGSYTIHYTVSDAAGNLGTAERNVMVWDTLPPLIALVGDSPQMVPCYSFTELGATATDSCDGEVAVTITGTVGNDSETYLRYYTAMDASGNSTTATRSVIVDCDESWCEDRDDNGLPDRFDNCLVLDGTSVRLDTDGGTCTRHLYATTWFRDVAGFDIAVVQDDPNGSGKVLNVLVPREVIGPTQQAVLVVLMSCSLEDLLGDIANTMEQPPANLAGIDLWFELSILVTDDGWATYQPLDNATLAANPITVYVEHLSAPNDATPLFEAIETYITQDEETGANVFAIGEGAVWSIDGLRYAYHEQTLVCETSRVGTFGIFTTPEPPPSLQVTTSPTIDVLFGIVQVGLDAMHTITVKNIGGGVLQGAAVVEDPSGVFGLVGDATFSLAAGLTDTITLRFMPRIRGDFHAKLRIDTNAGAPVYLTLKGTGRTYVEKGGVVSCDGTSRTQNGATDFAVVALALLYLVTSVRARNAPNK